MLRFVLEAMSRIVPVAVYIARFTFGASELGDR
jgi:hypothetical protein